MKTAILAGPDNLVFFATDLINPAGLKLIGYASPIEQAWNIYDAHGNVREDLEEMPVMPLEAAVGLEPDVVVLAASNREDEEQFKYAIVRTGYRGEVISLCELQQSFSPKTAALRKLAWRLDELGVEGAAADLGAGHGDISWQMNALMPARKLYLFETFTGYDERDVQKEHALGLSDVRVGDHSFTLHELERAEERILERMPYPEQVRIANGWFPETAYDLEDEHYALVHIDTGLYNPTYAGIQYFFSRLSKGGVIVLSGYEDGKTQSVRRAVDDLEKHYGAFLILPLCDLDGTVMIVRP